MKVLGFNLHRDTGYTEVFRGFPQSSCTFLDTTINYATVASIQILSNSLFTVLLAKAKKKKASKMLSYKYRPASTCEQCCLS